MSNINRKLTVGSLKSASVKNNQEPKAPDSPRIPKTVSRPPMSGIRLMQGGNVYGLSFSPGKNVLQSALDNGLPIQFKCRKGSCGVCKIRVISGSGLLEAANKRENKLLSDDVKAGYRLACQATMKSSFFDQ